MTTKQRGRVRKRNNEFERTRRIAAATLKNCAVAFVSGNTVKHLISLKHKKQVLVTPSLDHAAHRIRWQWTVLISVFCRDQSGQQYVKSQELAPAGEFLYSELAETLNDMHCEFLNTAVDARQVIGVGWMAVPRRESLDENLAGEIYSLLGAFDGLANWEQEPDK